MEMEGKSLVQGYPVCKADLHPDSLTPEPKISTIILILYITWGQYEDFRKIQIPTQRRKALLTVRAT